jgi:hypothetical protein
MRAVNSKTYFSLSRPGPERTERSAGPGTVGGPGGKPGVGRYGRPAAVFEVGRGVEKFYSDYSPANVETNSDINQGIIVGFRPDIS